MFSRPELNMGASHAAIEGRAERSEPSVSMDATLELNPVKACAVRTPIFVEELSLFLSF